MADVLLSPRATTTTTEPSSINAAENCKKHSQHHRLNWLSWMRKSLTLGNKHYRRSGSTSKLCACGLHHSSEETRGLRSVFTTQMSSQQHAVAQNERTCSSPPNSPISEHGVDSRGAGGRLLPLRPIHLASRCHEEVLYTRLNRSCSINSAASIPTPLVEKNITAVAPAQPPPSELDESPPTSITNDDQQDLDDVRVMVDLDAIEVVSNLDEARLLGDAGQMEACSSSIASSTASSQSSSSSKCLSKFSSPFRRKPKGLRKSKEESFEKFLLSTSEDEATATAAAAAATAPNSVVAGNGASAISRDELLRLFILKLDEEANYFQVSASPEEELCDCQKCQIYYCEYYEKYLEEYERRRAIMMTAAATAPSTVGKAEEMGQQPPTTSNLEASILMDDIMNNGMTFCSIM